MRGLEAIRNQIQLTCKSSSQVSFVVTFSAQVEERRKSNMVTRASGKRKKTKLQLSITQLRFRSKPISRIIRYGNLRACFADCTFFFIVLPQTGL